MRIKMRSLVSFLGFAVAIFMLGDLFLFSSVGRHGRRLAADDPYHVTDGRFLKRRIKSGKEYLSEGVRHFADRLYDGSDATDNPDGSRYDGVRDSVLGAMEVPGMKRKILPLARNKDLGELGLSGDLYRLEQLEKDLMAGTLHEEEEREEGQDLADNRAEDDYWGEDSEVRITTEVTNPEDNNIPADDQGFGFSWSNIFGLGRKESSSDSDVLDQSPDGTDRRGPEDRDRGMERYENINWNIGDMDAAGLDSSVLSKLTFVQEDQLFQKKPTDDARIVEVAPPSDEYLKRERLATELRQIKDLANSIPDWQDDVPKTAPTSYPVRSLADNVPASQDGESQSPSSIQRFFSSLFQPLSFAGTTGDEDEDDGGWASVAELDHFDSLIDEVNQMMIPGVNWKLQPQETVVIQEKGTSEGESSAENVPSSEPSLKVNMVAVPGFETDFFQKFGDMKQEEAPEYAMPDTSLSKDEISDDRQVAGIPSDFFSKFFQSANAPDAVPPAVPESSAAAAAPAAEGAQPDTLQVPSIPGLTEDFFNKYAKLTDFSEGLLSL
ncbi:hypothetical protein LSH36_298g01070 [Paralvinella palmiformis]|uniref:Uncharacterized protein n=1 Tax=Paralvinella palmiformis TaxID=53620 RepID=A0AAD9N3Y3_9ANNE|nr:hypothetical protein LSH36_298g01070 [Paralvinella palmiformis]